MAAKWMRPFFIAAGLVLGGAVAFLLAPFLLVAAIGAIAGGIAGAVVAGLLARRQPPEPAPAAGRDEPDVGALFRTLVGANITARSTPFAPDATVAVERVIDALRRSLPEANGAYHSNALTWDLNQAAREYLPRIVGRYAALSPAQREEQKATVLATLTGLAEAIERAEQAIHSRKDDEFAIASKFLNARFTDTL